MYLALLPNWNLFWKLNLSVGRSHSPLINKMLSLSLQLHHRVFQVKGTEKCYYWFFKRQKKNNQSGNRHCYMLLQRFLCSALGFYLAKHLHKLKSRSIFCNMSSYRVLRFQVVFMTFNLVHIYKAHIYQQVTSRGTDFEWFIFNSSHHLQHTYTIFFLFCSLQNRN